MPHNDELLAVALANVEANDNAVKTPPPSFALSDCHGIVGDYVRLWAPHTEASPVAIYTTALATCGALIGRGPTWPFGNAHHHARLFVLLIGRTSAGRKGTALSLGAKQFTQLVDEDFAATRCTSGLSSAEGLIAEIRDGTPERQQGARTIPADPGVLDKRLCVVEGELGGPLEAMAREGNRLSAVLRDLWDGVDVRTLVKTDPQRSTRPHVSVIGAITPDELRRLLSKTSISNGLANRFLPVWAERSQSLPDDRAPEQHELDRVTGIIRRRLNDARKYQRMTWHPEGAALWRQVYDELSPTSELSSTIDALLARGAPYVRRVAMILALLDGASEVDAAHLNAAVQVWRYAEATWRYVYPDSSPRSELAVKLFHGLYNAGAEGLTKTQIRRDVVKSNAVDGARIDAALQELVTLRMAVRAFDDGANGRRAERWTLAAFMAQNEGLGQIGQNDTREPLLPISPTLTTPPSAKPAIGPGVEPFDWASLEEAA
jgi:hypothetical protein